LRPVATAGCARRPHEAPLTPPMKTSRGTHEQPAGRDVPRPALSLRRAGTRPRTWGPCYDSGNVTGADLGGTRPAQRGRRNRFRRRRARWRMGSRSREVKVTIRDVAAEAGVGIATASRALNDGPEVSEETKRRVLAAARALGYRRSSVAV